MRIHHILVALLLAFAVNQVGAGTLVEFKFDDPQQTEDFRTLASELRCLVCQNESLAGSNAELAQDLRKEIYEMMQAGKTKEEIIEFMVVRYGDFILYRPPLKPSTYPLWFGPFLLLAIGQLEIAAAVGTVDAYDVSPVTRACTTRVVSHRR